MEVFLIRHGETVDNVAGLYAGVRDSLLTVHGTEQARRLGESFSGKIFTHLFSSPLSRAFKTAEAIQNAQNRDDGVPDIIQVPELIEQNFGSFEGVPFHRRTDSNKTGKEAYREEHKDDPDFVDMESKESMARRADIFLDQHIMPLFRSDSGPTTIAIVSHGMLLTALWRRLLLRMPTKSVTIAPEVIAARGAVVLEYLGSWGNTGYLELALSKPTTAVAESADTTSLVSETSTSPTPVEPPNADTTSSATDSTKDITIGWSMVVRGVDMKEHLVGLKRQRGGIGRSAYDASQKKLDSFFKRPRTD